MSYTSLSFILSVFICTIIYYIVRPKYRWGVLLVASVLFYILNSGLLTFYLVGATTTIYICGILIERQKDLFKAKKKELEKAERKKLKAQVEKREKGVQWTGISILLVTLIVLKYSPMAVNIANVTLKLFGSSSLLSVPKFALPLGISYYTLMAISYLSDVRLDKVTAEKNPLKLSLFTFFFPHITEGPFSRYGELSKDLFAGKAADANRMISGVVRAFYGLIKKMVIADRAAFLVNAVFEKPDSYSSFAVLLACVFYVIQLYAEFSGCIDIVCGISDLLGISLPENFRRPFFSRSVDEFWRRWHISLGSWLRDYIFYPISFSKPLKKLGVKAREKLGDYYGVLVPSAIALLVVWCLIGLWHGASFKYLLYGLYYYVLMMLGKFAKPLIDKMLDRLKISRDSTGYKVFDIARTNILVTFGMLIFRASTLTECGGIVKMIFTNGIKGASIFAIENFTYKDLIVVLIGVVVLLVIDILKEKNISVREKIASLPKPVCILIFVALCYLLIIFGIYGEGSGASPFIYGQY